MSHSPENLRRGILYCCCNFGYRKFWDKQGGVSRFSVEIFCLTVPKVFVGNSFTVALFSGIEKVWIIRGGVSSLSVENFLSHGPENFRRGILYCRSDFG